MLSITPIDVLGSLLTGYGSGYYVHGGLVIYIVAGFLQRPTKGDDIGAILKIFHL